jgi:ABC-2 type transport system permease protein
MISMRKLLAFSLRARFGPKGMKSMDPKTKLRSIGMFILFAFLAVYFVGIFSFMVWSIWTGIVDTPLLPAMMSTLFIGSFVVVLLFGVMYLLSFVFLAKDIAFYAALPIPQRRVFMARFLQVLLAEIGTQFLMLMPVLVINGIHTGGDVLYYLKGLVLILFAPCVPLAVGGVLSLLVMPIVNFFRSRQFLLALFQMIIILIPAMAYGYFAQTLMMNLESGGMTAFLMGQADLIHTVAGSYPPAGWAATALLDSSANGMLNLLYFVLVSVAALIPTALIAGRLYYRSALAQSESAKGRSRGAAKTSFKRKSPVRAFMMRDFRDILRTPVYAMNCLCQILMVPLMLGIMAFSMNANGGPEVMDQLALLLADVPLVLSALIFAAAALFFSGFIAMAASTCISREGKTFWQAKSLPVPGSKQVAGKFLCALIIALISVVLLMIMVWAFVPVSPLVPVLGTVVCLPVLIVQLTLQVMIDLARPKLTWNSPAEAVKQNMNGMLGMLVAALVLMAVGFGAYMLIFEATMDPAVVLVIVTAVSAVAAVLCYAGMLRMADRRYVEIEA